jgi:DNA-binding transcriptional LysR family regulator
MRPVTFDLDVLRTFIVGVELGSFALAAQQLGRSRSALSAQLRRLEEQAGAPVFRKSGRGLALTPVGETVLAYARRLLELDDEAAIAVRGVEVEGWVRLGTQEDLGAGLLPDVLRRFARAHPKVRIEARVARNAELLERVKAGSLDLALVWGDGTAAPNGERLAQLPMCWVGSAEFTRASASSPLPLAAVEAPCHFRDAATAALDRARIPWRLAFTSASLGGVWAAASAGIGLTVRTGLGQPAGLRALGAGLRGLPALPSLGLSLHRAEAHSGPAVGLLAALVAEAVEEAVAALPAAGAAVRTAQGHVRRTTSGAASKSKRPRRRA